MLHVPSVTMKGGSLTSATSTPLMKPQTMPVRNPSAKATSGGQPQMTARRPITTEDSTMMTPTERSMPAVRITSVWAMPRVPMMVTCCSTSDRLVGAVKAALGKRRAVAAVAHVCPPIVPALRDTFLRVG